MSNIIPFNFDGQQVSVVRDDNGEPWFIAKEISAVLGYSDAFEMTKRLDEDEKQNLQIAGFGPRGVTLVNESGLYVSVLGSTKPEAKPFKKWVTSEVLPSIRKTGGYQIGGEPVKQATEALKLTPLAVRAARAFGLDKNAAAISANQFVRKLTGVNLLEDFGSTHLVAANQEALFYTPTELGKMLPGEPSARRVNLLLAEAGLQAKQGEYWKPLDVGQDFARVYDTSKKHSDGVPVQQVKWSDAVLPLLKKEEMA